MMHIRRILLPAAIVVAAACSRGSDRPPDGDAAAGAASPSAGAEPAGTATAPLTVTERGIGPLRAGMSLADASAALGGALVVPAGADTAGCSYLEWRGGPAGVRVMVEGGRIARVDVDTAGIATAAGAGVGDSEARIQSLYPGRVAVSPRKYEDGHYLTVTPDTTATGFAIVFETVNDHVTRFRAGRRPQVEYVEGCG